MRTLSIAACAAVIGGTVAAEAGETALERAILDGDQAAATAAVAAGEGINEAFPGGLMTPLGLAVARGDGGMVEHLLESGAAINATSTWGITPLAVAAQSCHAGTGIVGTLVDAGADLDVRGPGDMTPLLIAALKGRSEIVRALAEAGADAAAVDVFGDGALNYAIYARDNDQVRLALAAGAGTAQLDVLFLTRGYLSAVWPGPWACPEEG